MYAIYHYLRRFCKKNDTFKKNQMILVYRIFRKDKSYRHTSLYKYMTMEIKELYSKKSRIACEYCLFNFYISNNHCMRYNIICVVLQ